MPESGAPRSNEKPNAGSTENALAWYSKAPGDKLTGEVRELFVRYSGVSAEDVERHVCDVVSFIVSNAFAKSYDGFGIWLVSRESGVQCRISLALKILILQLSVLRLTVYASLLYTYRETAHGKYCHIRASASLLSSISLSQSIHLTDESSNSSVQPPGN